MSSEQPQDRTLTVSIIVPGSLAATDDDAIDLVGDRLDGLTWSGSLSRSGQQR